MLGAGFSSLARRPSLIRQPPELSVAVKKHPDTTRLSSVFCSVVILLNVSCGVCTAFAESCHFALLFLWKPCTGTVVKLLTTFYRVVFCFASGLFKPGRVALEFTSDAQLQRVSPASCCD